jgi:hypothetical protein
MRTIANGLPLPLHSSEAVQQLLLAWLIDGVLIKWCSFMQRGAGKQLQDFGEELSAKVQETAENVRDSLQGAQSDASSKASSAARTGQSKLEQGADDAEGLGAKIGNQAENLKVYMHIVTNRFSYHISIHVFEPCSRNSSFSHLLIVYFCLCPLHSLAQLFAAFFSKFM